MTPEGVFEELNHIVIYSVRCGECVLFRTLSLVLPNCFLGQCSHFYFLTGKILGGSRIILVEICSLRLDLVRGLNQKNFPAGYSLKNTVQDVTFPRSNIN